MLERDAQAHAKQRNISELLHGEVAHGVWRSLMRDWTVRMKQNGVPMPWYAQQVLEALAQEANVPLPSAIGRPVVTVEVTNWVSVREAAETVKRSERQITRLANEGKVRARRVNERSWLIDLDSLRSVMERRNG
ncbi:helix-turn-helix domain-containing protein [Leifsonia naganoensis]|uniref:Helix-turn-helix domain-containing protein n=1 Tax=Leifsonia naganoensis TaxID=150025 RepID=A0A853DSE4_9MICO|nr:helix-turn-helix domain-containing protein [Leifsonia naganoensis]NYK08575.1 hypothetical protein [Leifsonia naganoensis]